MTAWTCDRHATVNLGDCPTCDDDYDALLDAPLAPYLVAPDCYETPTLWRRTDLEPVAVIGQREIGDDRVWSALLVGLIAARLIDLDEESA